MTCRYDTFLNGRLLRVTDLVYVPTYGATSAADPGPGLRAADYVPGEHRWYVDGRLIAQDIAAALLIEHGRTVTLDGKVIGDHPIPQPVRQAIDALDCLGTGRFDEDDITALRTVLDWIAAGQEYRQ